MTGDLQWDWLRTFEAVARFGSLTAGARALRMSQSTASRHLARLEEYAKAPLLNRQNPVRLTARAKLLAAIVPMVEAATVASSAIEPLG
ncbi:MAG: LysR family transcriptional regulator [Polyangiaceae bacterium]